MTAGLGDVVTHFSKLILATHSNVFLHILA